MFLLHIPANLCTDLTVDFSLVLDISIPTLTGANFSLQCIVGYSTSVRSGALVCSVTGVWENKAQCEGKWLSRGWDSEKNSSRTVTVKQLLIMCLSLFYSAHYSLIAGFKFFRTVYDMPIYTVGRLLSSAFQWNFLCHLATNVLYFPVAKI